MPDHGVGFIIVERFANARLVFEGHVHSVGQIVEVAVEPQRHRPDAGSGPVLRRIERAARLRIRRGARVIVGKRQRLCAAVNDGLLGEGGFSVADLRAVLVDLPSVRPRIEDTIGCVVVVVLELVHDKIVRGGEAPDVATP